MRIFKERVWNELSEKITDKELIAMWSSIDSGVFNSYPFKLLCEKVEELEDEIKGQDQRPIK